MMVFRLIMLTTTEQLPAEYCVVRCRPSEEQQNRHFRVVKPYDVWKEPVVKTHVWARSLGGFRQSQTGQTSLEATHC